MNENERKRIFAILKEIYKYEKFIKSPPQNSVYKGYLIEKNLMESFKKKIFYEELKPELSGKCEFSKIILSFDKKNIEKLEKINYINQSKFNNLLEFKKALDDDQNFVIITFSLWVKICSPEKKNESGIQFIIKDNKINIKFNEDDKIIFYYNNGIIEKNNLINSIVSNRRSQLRKKSSKKIEIESIELKPINKLEVIKEIKFDSYSCTNCKSEIELEKINFNGENNEDTIIFNCTGNCGKITISINEYFKKIIDNIYLNEKCSDCGKSQLRECLNNKNNIFIYCIECNKKYCNNCKENCEHNDFIKINEINNKCLVHKNKELCSFCDDDKIQLCKNCINNGTHRDHNIIDFNDIVIKNEEIEIFKNILNYFNQQIKEINEEKKKKIKENYDKKKEQTKLNFENEKKQLILKQNEIINDKSKKYNDKEEELKKNIFNKFKEKPNHIFEEFSTLISLLDNDILTSNYNNLNNNCNIFEKFFDKIDELKNNYKNQINELKNNYDKSIIENKKINDNEIQKIKDEYENKINESKKNYDSNIKQLDENYNNNINNISKELKDFKLNNYINQIKFGETIYNTYNLHKSNYYNIINMYNLMRFYYNNKEIYDKIVLKEINKSNDKDLLAFIEEKKAKKFEIPRYDRNIEKKKTFQFSKNQNFVNFLIPNKKKSIKEEFIVTPLIGLEKNENINYANAILQCFCQIEKIANFFKYNSQIVNLQQQIIYYNSYLFTSFKNLIENLWPSNEEYINNKYIHQNNTNKYFSPYEFYKKIANMNEIFKPKNKNTPKDLITFIIITLHKELNKAKENNNNNGGGLNNDERNRKNMRSIFINNFVKENKSIISDLFYSMEEIISQCNKCNTIKYNYQTYFYFDFPINEILELKKKSNENRISMPFQNNNINNYMNASTDNNLNYFVINSVNIFDCFSYYQKINRFSNKNSIYCKYCNSISPFCYRKNLIYLPEILVIFINRRFDLNIKFQFFEQINLQNYIEFKNTGFDYKLIGVVASNNENGEEENYIAYCQSPVDNKWYRYIDDKVYNVINFEQQILKNSKPYIIFYKKIN